jgi:hypothetical protein
MSKKTGFENLALTPEALTILKSVKAKVDAGEEANPQIVEALKAIDLASKVVNTIMSGNQIDPVFFKQLTDVTEQRMIGPKVVIQKRTKVKKKRKLRRKIKT